MVCVLPPAVVSLRFPPAVVSLRFQFAHKRSEAFRNRLLNGIGECGPQPRPEGTREPQRIEQRGGRMAHRDRPFRQDLPSHSRLGLAF